MAIPWRPIFRHSRRPFHLRTVRSQPLISPRWSRTAEISPMDLPGNLGSCSAYAKWEPPFIVLSCRNLWYPASWFCAIYGTSLKFLRWNLFRIVFAWNESLLVLAWTPSVIAKNVVFVVMLSPILVDQTHIGWNHLAPSAEICQQKQWRRRRARWPHATRWDESWCLLGCTVSSKHTWSKLV